MSVVVTGVGVVSAIGSGAAFARALEGGVCGIRELTGFDPGEWGPTLAAEVIGFAVEDYLASAKTYLDPASAYALAASALALSEAGVRPEPGRDLAPGVSLGTAFGCLATMGTFWEGVLDKGPRLASSLLFTHSYANTPSSLVAIEFSLSGPHGCFTGGAASGALALADAWVQVHAGRTSAMLAGGMEALSPFAWAALAASGILSSSRAGASGLHPFAASSDGTVLGEGAAILVLEPEAAALDRGARRLARLAGCGLSGEAGATGATRAIRAALDAAGLRPREVDAVFASANGVCEGDAAEADALVQVFGPLGVPVVATKALVGETLGAGGPIAAAAAVRSLQGGALPPTPTEAPGYPLDLVRERRSPPLRRVLVNAFDVRAGCVSLVLESPQNR